LYRLREEEKSTRKSYQPIGNEESQSAICPLCFRISASKRHFWQNIAEATKFCLLGLIIKDGRETHKNPQLFFSFLALTRPLLAKLKLIPQSL
jgi:hypothetical protein